MLYREPGSEPVTVHAVRAAAVVSVPGTTQAVISLVTGGKPIVRAQAASNATSQYLDALQGELDDGPCLRAIWEQQTVRIPNLATDAPLAPLRGRGH